MICRGKSSPQKIKLLLGALRLCRIEYNALPGRHRPPPHQHYSQDNIVYQNPAQDPFSTSSQIAQNDKAAATRQLRHPDMYSCTKLHRISPNRLLPLRPLPNSTLRPPDCPFHRSSTFIRTIKPPPRRPNQLDCVANHRSAGSANDLPAIHIPGSGSVDPTHFPAHPYCC